MSGSNLRFQSYCLLQVHLRERPSARYVLCRRSRSWNRHLPGWFRGPAHSPGAPYLSPGNRNIWRNMSATKLISLSRRHLVSMSWLGQLAGGETVQRALASMPTSHVSSVSPNSIIWVPFQPIPHHYNSISTNSINTLPFLPIPSFEFNFTQFHEK